MRLVDTLELKGTQSDAAFARGHDVSVSAGAGSGKTTTLVARYLSLLGEKHPPRAVVAVTFTKKAAREMRNRIRAAIHAWLAGDCPDAERPFWQDIEADIDTARIGTIHSLCEAILRAHPAEAGIDPGFGVLDEGLGAALEAQVVDETLNWATQQPGLRGLFDAFNTRTLQEVLAVLLAKRLEVTQAFRRGDIGQVWNHALQDRLKAFARRVGEDIAELIELSQSGLQANAGDKLAAQVREFLSEWNLFSASVASGNAFAAAQHLFAIRRAHSNGTIGRHDSRAKQAVKSFRESYDDSVNSWLGGKRNTDTPPDAARESQLLEMLPMLQSLYAQALASYSAYKEIRRELDFDDLEAKALELLQSKTIRSRWQAEIKALLVDEFQDTNERQRQIVEALAGTEDGETGRLFVVGDAKQSIYRFRGADVGVFRNLADTIRARGGLPLELNQTFRAHTALITGLNEILETIMASDSRFAVPFAPLNSDRSQPVAGVTEPYIEFLWGLGDDAESSRVSSAYLLAERLVALHSEENVGWYKIALLFRASTGFPNYEDALEAAGIPFVTVAGRGFYDRPEIRDLLNLLRAVANPWDNLAMAGLLRSPAIGVTDEGMYLLRWSKGNDDPIDFWTAIDGEMPVLADPDRARARDAHTIVTQLVKIVDRATVAELLKRLLDTTYYPAILAAHPGGSRLQRNVEKLLADAQASGIVRVEEFLEYVESLNEAGAREGEAPSEAGQAVRLMTIHKAKGLEFPVVVLADASRGRPSTKGSVLLPSELGLVPSPDRWEDYSPLVFGLAKAIEQEQSDAEDLRLIYVAATRASEKVIFCGHQVNRSQVWLERLANAAGLGLASVIEKPGEWVGAKLAKCGVMVRGMGKKIDPVQLIEPAEGGHVLPVSSATALNAPLLSKRERELDQKEIDSADNDRRLRRIIGRGGARRADGTVLGILVHAALRRWKFPGDAGLDQLLQAEASMSGLVEESERELTLTQTMELLARFRAAPRFSEIDSATERRHEIPYSLLGSEGLPATGVIDLIYRVSGGRWQIVDFKSDQVADAGAFEGMKRTYFPQLQRYRSAFGRLLGQPAEAWLCCLNYFGSVRWEPLS